MKQIIDFFKTDKAPGIVLMLCAAVSLLLANSPLQNNYTGFWKLNIAGHPFDHWINDGFMAIFFLLIGLELKKEIYKGGLSNLKSAMLPISAAIGGMLVPAGIYFFLNYGTPTQAGTGIPMATDIVFALAVLSLLGKRVPASIKIFLTALAVIDDLGAILTIAVFYAKGLSVLNLVIALGIFLVLVILNRLKVRRLLPFLFGGIAMWYFMLHSGVHATIAGVLLAFVIPFGDGRKEAASYRLEHFLHRPVNFLILPIFALANTAISLQDTVSGNLFSSNTQGIFYGLFFGKPIGILLCSFLAVSTGICTKPANMKWVHIACAGILGGIGFTMSIFITLLAFSDNVIIDSAKVAIIVTSTISAIVGFVLLRMTLQENDFTQRRMAHG